MKRMNDYYLDQQGDDYVLYGPGYQPGDVPAFIGSYNQCVYVANMSDCKNRFAYIVSDELKHTDPAYRSKIESAAKTLHPGTLDAYKRRCEYLGDVNESFYSYLREFHADVFADLCERHQYAYADAKMLLDKNIGDYLTQAGVDALRGVTPEPNFLYE